MSRFRLPVKPTLIALVILACSALLLLGFVLIASDFGLRAAAALLLLFLLPPLVVALRLRRRWPTVGKREVVYLAVLTCVAFGAIIFVVRDWYDKGIDHDHAVAVQWSRFERLIRRDPAFRDVQVKVTARKRIYYVEGTVASEADVDRLKSLALNCGIERVRLDGPYMHSISLRVLSRGGGG